MAKICVQCQDKFSNSAIINGVRKNIQNRKYCLKCSPWGLHNTRKIHQVKHCKHSRDYSLMSDTEKRQYNDKIYKYQRQQRQKRKVKLVNQFGGKCSSCGYDKNLTSLCFHHKNPKEKEFMLNSREMYKRPEKELIEEAKKCELLCHNCHSELHNPQFNNWKDFKTIPFSDFWK